MDMTLFNVNTTIACCSRCGDEKTTLNQFGVCDQCNVEIDEEYLEIYDLQNMEF